MFAPPVMPSQDNLQVLADYLKVSVDSLVCFYEGNPIALPLSISERLLALHAIDLSRLSLELSTMPALENLCNVVASYLKISKILTENA